MSKATLRRSGKKMLTVRVSYNLYHEDVAKIIALGFLVDNYIYDEDRGWHLEHDRIPNKAECLERIRCVLDNNGANGVYYAHEDCDIPSEVWDMSMREARRIASEKFGFPYEMPNG